MEPQCVNYITLRYIKMPNNYTKTNVGVTNIKVKIVGLDKHQSGLISEWTSLLKM